jgi:hypothetical protein
VQRAITIARLRIPTRPNGWKLRARDSRRFRSLNRMRGLAGGQRCALAPCPPGHGRRGTLRLAMPRDRECFVELQPGPSRLRNRASNPIRSVSPRRAEIGPFILPTFIDTALNGEYGQPPSNQSRPPPTEQHQWRAIPRENTAPDRDMLGRANLCQKSELRLQGK